MQENGTLATSDVQTPVKTEAIVLAAGALFLHNAVNTCVAPETNETHMMLTAIANFTKAYKSSMLTTITDSAQGPISSMNTTINTRKIQPSRRKCRTAVQC